MWASIKDHQNKLCNSFPIMHALLPFPAVYPTAGRVDFDELQLYRKFKYATAVAQDMNQLCSVFAG